MLFEGDNRIIIPHLEGNFNFFLDSTCEWMFFAHYYTKLPEKSFGPSTDLTEQTLSSCKGHLIKNVQHGNHSK